MQQILHDLVCGKGNIAVGKATIYYTLLQFYNFYKSLFRENCGW